MIIDDSSYLIFSQAGVAISGRDLAKLQISHFLNNKLDHEGLRPCTRPWVLPLVVFSGVPQIRNSSLCGTPGRNLWGLVEIQTGNLGSCGILAGPLGHQGGPCGPLLGALREPFWVPFWDFRIRFSVLGSLFQLQSQFWKSRIPLGVPGSLLG